MGGWEVAFAPTPTATAQRLTSAPNTAQSVTLTGAISQMLALLMQASAGVATVTVDVSTDGANWVTVDALVAALTTVKHYTSGTVGVTTALSPLAFPFIRISVGAAGLGNTTTLTLSYK
jgi:hypothetical protein